MFPHVALHGPGVPASSRHAQIATVVTTLCTQDRRLHERLGLDHCEEGRNKERGQEGGAGQCVLKGQIETVV